MMVGNPRGHFPKEGKPYGREATGGLSNNQISGNICWHLKVKCSKSALKRATGALGDDVFRTTTHTITNNALSF